ATHFATGIEGGMGPRVPCGEGRTRAVGGWIGAEAHDPPGHLVALNARSPLEPGPLAPPHVEVRSTDAGERDLDQNLVRPWLRHIVFGQLHRAAVLERDRRPTLHLL